MREIIFRAKVEDKDELIGKGFPINGTMTPISKWVYGVPTPILGYPDLFTAWNVFNGEYEELTVITETIGQYTGLTDKNGTKIFEGDILQYDDGDEYDESEKAVVVWMDSGFWLEYHNGQTEPWYEQDWGYGNVYFEVIGNIHDNPELLTDSN